MTTITGHGESEQDYGYLSYKRHVVHGIEEVNRLVRTITMSEAHVGSLPLTFFSLALHISSSRSCVRRLIQAFLHTCASFPVPDGEYTWHNEARFARARAHYLGLVRVLHVSGLGQCRSFVKAAEKAFGTLSVSQNPIPLLRGSKVNPGWH